MKKIFKLLMFIICIFIISCDKSNVVIKVYNLIEIYENEEFDYSKYIKITKDNINVVVEDKYITTNLDVTKEGKYKVVVEFENVKKEMTVVVLHKKEIKVEYKDTDEVTVENINDIDYNDYFTIYEDDIQIKIKDDYISLEKIDDNNYIITLLYKGITKKLKVFVISYYIEITNKINELYSDSYKLNIDTNIDSYKVESSDENVLKVDDNTLIKVNDGTCTVKVSGQNHEDSFTVSVKTFNLDNAINKLNDKNYKLIYTINILDENIFMTSEYKYDGDNVSYTYYEEVTYTDYLITHNNTKYYYTMYDNDLYQYEAFVEGSSKYNLYSSYIEYFDFNILASSEYEITNNKLVYKDINKVCDAIFNFDECTYSDFKVSFSQNTIDKIECVVLYEGIKYVYTLIFSDYSNIVIDVSDILSLVKVENPNEIIFTDEFFSNSANISFESTQKPFGFTNNRGIQFLQNGKALKIFSKKIFENVKSITLTVQTNSINGMYVEISVGDSLLYCEQSAKVLVEKTNFDKFVELTFTSNSLLYGSISITLTPNDTSKSMYIKSIKVNNDALVTDDVIYMDAQTYDETTLDKRTLQEHLASKGYATGLSPKGMYNVLVVPVNFSNSKPYTKEMLEVLDKAFNGNEAQTGYQSVKSYYQISSYNNLNMTFDICDVVNLPNTSRYYENASKQITVNDEMITLYDSEVIYYEVLNKLDMLIDFNNYDYNKDGYIDGVYLIYNYPIDYADDSFYWAFMHYTNDTNTYDGVYPNYYMFASFYFTQEESANPQMIINATTYIHETGHMLSLDDYYDYDIKKGCGKGVGCVDMMDDTVGDHCSYSKLMLGYLNPQIITKTTTVTLSPLSEKDSAILIPLDFNNSYMSEYLLIDFYKNNLLNSFHDEINQMYYHEKGVRIYHISSSIDNPFSTEYESFTDYNNTDTDIPLIKFVGVDGLDGKYNNEFIKLWLSGDKFSDVYENYHRNDNKVINFDITIDNVTDEFATVTITYINS